MTWYHFLAFWLLGFPLLGISTSRILGFWASTGFASKRKGINMAEHEYGCGTERKAKAIWAIPERRYLSGLVMGEEAVEGSKGCGLRRPREGQRKGKGRRRGREAKRGSVRCGVPSEGRLCCGRGGGGGVM
jgi:hypothetical protein